ncbi:NERD domain-containing protein [Streptomyces sp. NPDC047315]|uniref:nuclease-related domain-containing protein n=1 Tax=Streptomyces sp. NPDC047315 TaxID=3155142 RepID=UPI00340C91FD
MNAGNSAAARARELRGGLRAAVARPVRSWLGLRPSGRDQAAARWGHGAAGEEATAQLLAPLAALGWHIRHDLAMPGSRANLDTVLVSPCGTGLVVLDTKAWRRNWTTRIVNGRVHCGPEDRHDQIEKVAGYARRVQQLLGMPAGTVQPLLVVHGSPIPGGALTVRVTGWPEPVHVLAPSALVPTLAAAPRQRHPARARQLAARVDQILHPYQ